MLGYRFKRTGFVRCLCHTAVTSTSLRVASASRPIELFLLHGANGPATAWMTWPRLRLTSPMKLRSPCLDGCTPTISNRCKPKCQPAPGYPVPSYAQFLPLVVLVLFDFFVLWLGWWWLCFETHTGAGWMCGGIHTLLVERTYAQWHHHNVAGVKHFPAKYLPRCTGI